MRNTVICLTFIGLVLFSACRKKDDIPKPVIPTGPVTQQEINNWVLDSMRYFYLWADQLPGQPNNMLETQLFFEGIKSKDDKFSFIYNAEDPSTIKSDMLYKYGLDYSVISWPAAPGGVIGVVKLVVPGSYPAAEGLKRGDYFTRINETVLTAENAAKLSEDLLNASVGTVRPANVAGTVITERPLVQLSRQRQTANPLYLSKVFNVGAKKVGYIFYTAFQDGYNSYLLAAFQDFKSKGVQELIIDIRYNIGGSLAAAAMITTMIVPNVTDKSAFVQYAGNNRFPTRKLDFATVLSVPETGEPIAFNSLSGGRLSLPRVFVLSGRQTVSAAELLINNLKPYTEVIQIGETTYGKDKGAIIIQDMRTPKRISWVFHPIIYRLANANGEGGYTQGIPPRYTINEQDRQPLLPVGDAEDPLVTKALSLINGNGRVSVESIPTNTPVLYDTRQHAAANSVLLLPR